MAQHGDIVTADQVNNAISDDLELLSRSFTYCESFQVQFCYSCAGVDNISTDYERRAVPLRHLSILFVVVLLLF